MENNSENIKIHPYFIETLFGYKSKMFRVFRDVLGIHEINHISITRVNSQGQLLVLSSTPAMEFNLFTSNLWRFDNSYNSEWFYSCLQAEWRSLYAPERYDELYYLKQIKHQLPLGQSLAARQANNHYIYSIASKRESPDAQDIFHASRDNFYKIGQYCTQLLLPYFEEQEFRLSESYQEELI